MNTEKFPEQKRIDTLEKEKVDLDEIKKMPEEKKEKLGFGLKNMGFYIEEQKDNFFAKTLGKISEKFDKKSTAKRFVESLKEGFTEDAGKARKRMERIGRGEKQRFRNISYLSANILKYGRTMTDIAGYTLGSPFRYVMMGGMFFARGAEAAKEARLKNEEVIEKTRIQDIDEAAEEAWRIYEQAKAGKDEVNKEDLEKAYQNNIPEDLLKRLNKKPEPGVASGIIQKVIKWDMEKSIKKIDRKIKDIEKNQNFSDEERKLKKERIINRYSKHLNDLDRMVSQYGTVDAIAMGARYTKTASKAVVGGMMAETLVRLGVNLPKVFSTSEVMAAEKSDMDEPIAAKTTEAKIAAEADLDQPAGHEYIKTDSDQSGFSESAVIQKGEGIEHALIRQLKDGPEEFGFKGDVNNTEAVNEWAENEAHKIAIKAGYVDTETGQEIRVGTKGIAKAAYVLEKDTEGDIKVNEYFSDKDGKFASQEVHELAKDYKSAEFEGEKKEPYEYIHEKTVAEEELPKEEIKKTAPIEEEAPIETAKEELTPTEKLAQERLDARAGDIYKEKLYAFGDETKFDKDWPVMQEKSASDILAGKFGEPIDGLDQSEINNRYELQDYLKEAQETVGQPEKNEAVKDFLTRYEQNKLAQDLEIGEGKEEVALAEVNKRLEEVAEKVAGSSEILEKQDVINNYNMISDISHTEKRISLLELFKEPNEQSKLGLFKGTDVLEHDRVREVIAISHDDKLELHYNLKNAHDFRVYINNNGTAFIDGPAYWNESYNSLRDINGILKWPMEALERMEAGETGAEGEGAFTSTIVEGEKVGEVQPEVPDQKELLTEEGVKETVKEAMPEQKEAAVEADITKTEKLPFEGDPKRYLNNLSFRSRSGVAGEGILRMEIEPYSDEFKEELRKMAEEQLNKQELTPGRERNFNNLLKALETTEMDKVAEVSDNTKIEVIKPSESLNLDNEHNESKSQFKKVIKPGG